MMRVIATFGFVWLLLFPLTSLTQVAQTHGQQEHSKLYRNYGIKAHKLTEGQGDDGVVVHGLLRLYSTLPPRSAFFSKIACQSDAVILGKVLSQTPLLTPEESFIFTDAEISVLEVLKDNPSSHLSPTQKVTVTRPGGSLQQNGRNVTAKLTEFRDFFTGGQYLLFVKFLPTTQDYQALGDRTFELRNGMAFNLTREALWDGQPSRSQDAVAALADARTAVTGPCN